MILEGHITKLSGVSAAWKILKNSNEIRNALGNDFSKIDNLFIEINKIVEEHGL